MNTRISRELSKERNLHLISILKKDPKMSYDAIKEVSRAAYPDYGNLSSTQISQAKKDIKAEGKSHPKKRRARKTIMEALKDGTVPVVYPKEFTDSIEVVVRFMNNFDCSKLSVDSSGNVTVVREETVGFKV